MLWLSEDKNKDSQTVIFPLKSDKNNENLTVNVVKKSSKVIPHLFGDKFDFTIECTGDANIKDVKNINLTPEMVAEIEHNTEKILEKQINDLISKSQNELNADFIGFSKTIFNNYPKQWLNMKKNWNEIYPNIKYKVNFKIELTNIGNIEHSVLESN